MGRSSQNAIVLRTPESPSLSETAMLRQPPSAAVNHCLRQGHYQNVWRIALVRHERVPMQALAQTSSYKGDC